jgi:hypothetical protein
MLGQKSIHIEDSIKEITIQLGYKNNSFNEANSYSGMRVKH